MEFALVVPVFLLVVFGIMYFGFIFAQNLALGNAARQGARAAVVNDGTTCGAVVSIVREASATIGLRDTSSVQVQMQRRTSSGLVNIAGCVGPLSTTNTTVPCVGATVGDSIFVTATFSNTMSFPVTPPKVDAKGKGEFRCEFH